MTFPQVRAGGWEESADKPDSVPGPVARPPVATICLGRRSPDASCGLPGTRRRPKPPDRTGHPRPCLALLRMGLAEPRRSPAVLVSSYLTVSPLPRAVTRGGLLSVALAACRHAWALPSTLPCGVRTFLARAVDDPRAAAWPTPPEARGYARPAGFTTIEIGSEEGACGEPIVIWW